MHKSKRTQDKDTFIRTFVFFTAALAVRATFAWNLAIPVPFGFSCAYPFVIMSSLALSVYVTMRLQWQGVSYALNGVALFAIGALGMGFIAQACFYAGRQFPLMDDMLASVDTMLGFDWRAYMGFFEERSWLAPVLVTAYGSIVWQPVVIIAALAARHDAARICAFLSAQMSGLMVVCVVAAFLPVLGAFRHYGILAADHPHLVLDDPARWTTSILWLRAATFSTRVSTDIGLVTFPSFHTFCAVLYVWAAWSVPRLRWCALALNLAMLIATPLYGSHYLVDVIAGGAISVLLIATVRHIYGLAVETARVAPRRAARGQRDITPVGGLTAYLERF